MKEWMSFDWWFYGGIFVMASAGILFAVQTVLFAVKRKRIGRRMDEEYGQPGKYHNESSQS